MMRKVFSESVEQIALQDDKTVFITCDLGYNAFENLQAKMGERFINAGVAEQNMIGVAAGMAHRGYKVFCYCIAPFIVYRCLEQVRNDVCFHKLPVFLVGNGGGYGYGIMGPSHHALEDLACLSSLPGMKCWVPAFEEEIEPVLHKIMKDSKPAYLRLGLDKQTFVLGGHKKTRDFIHYIAAIEPEGCIITSGPIINNVFRALIDPAITDKFDVFSCLALPVHDIPEILERKIRETGNVIIVEDHISAGGLAQQLAPKLMERNIPVNNFISLNAKGYPGETYGSQEFHRKASGLDSNSIVRVLKSVITQKIHSESIY